jgi:transcriptional regulator with XRE-family HTH domain
MTVGSRIKQRRLEMGLTQSELAEKMGYSGKTSVCMAEKGGDNITTTKVKKFAEALGVSFRYLMGLDEQIADTINAIGQVIDFRTKAPNGDEYNIEIAQLSKEYGEERLAHALEFVKAFLEATPERQQIVLDILQSHQGGS